MQYGNKTFNVTLGGEAYSKNWEQTFRGEAPPSELEAPKKPSEQSPPHLHRQLEKTPKLEGPPSPCPTPAEIVSQGWESARSLHRGNVDY